MSKKRAKLSPLTVIGELLLLGGLGVFGYMLWQPWYADNIIAAEQNDISAEVSKKWQNADITESGDTDNLPVPKLEGYQNEIFGVLYVPAFGDNWSNQLASGELMNPIMDYREYGVAHYKSTQLPGEKGNFALAGHRSGGLPRFANTDFLRVGDPIFVETADGWYTYRFRSAEYVLPTEIDVLNPFPRIEKAKVEDSILTLTTCNPKSWGWDERMIVYSVFEDFTPRKDGPPQELIDSNSNVAQSVAQGDTNSTDQANASKKAVGGN